jgi:hypothetical protein
MSADSIDCVLDEHEKGKALALDIIKEAKASRNYDLISYVFDTQKAFDESGQEVDLVFERVSLEELGMFGDFVRIDGEIRLATDYGLHLGLLCFSAYKVSREVSDSVEDNIASYSRPTRKES